jgi:hypothetical protein
MAQQVTAYAGSGAFWPPIGHWVLLDQRLTLIFVSKIFIGFFAFTP